MFPVQMKVQHLHKKLAEKRRWARLSYVNFTDICSFSKCLCSQPPLFYILAFYGTCNHFRLRWNTIYKYWLFEGMLLSLFCYLKLQKSWSAFNFYSNALSAVTFSLRALFSPCQFSLLPSPFAQFRLNDWLVNGLGLPLYTEQTAQPPFLGGTAAACLNGRLPYYHCTGGRFVHIDTGINQEPRRHHCLD